MRRLSQRLKQHCTSRQHGLSTCMLGRVQHVPGQDCRIGLTIMLLLLPLLL
jgi:hypothetical protein